MRFWPVLAAVLLAAPGAALAKCASPGAFLVPIDGDLPANPSLHVFFPSWTKEPPVLTVTDEQGNDLEYRIVAVPSSKAFQVVRVEVETGAATSIVVSTESFRETKPRTYRIDRSYAPAPRARVRIEATSESSYQWTCSHEEVRSLSVDTAAPLYRVEWAESEKAFRAGERRTVLLAHRTQELAFRWNDKPVPATALLPLGYLNCTGATLEWEGPIWAAIVAMYPDGSETPLGEPEQIQPPSSSEGKSPDWSRRKE